MYWLCIILTHIMYKHYKCISKEYQKVDVATVFTVIIFDDDKFTII